VGGFIGVSPASFRLVFFSDIFVRMELTISISIP
jgi:hypothetical protein